MEDLEIYIGNNRTATSVRESELRYLSYVAISLNPSPDASTVSEGYLQALQEYLAKQDKNDPHVIAYHKIVKSANGDYLLPLSIQLALLEDFFRKHGIGKKEAERYNQTQAKYLEFIMVGNNLYDENYCEKSSFSR